MNKNKLSTDDFFLNTTSAKKQEQDIKRDKFFISNKVVRCPVLTPLERLAADLAWNG
ncbi:MAG: hypothetical protein GXP14_03930 [Gammaproteobacteria bacterium]|nr:hypothetical protein [Gammaproteobacteria bacterium]